MLTSDGAPSGNKPSAEPDAEPDTNGTKSKKHHLLKGRKPMDFAIFWLPIIGLTLLGIGATIFWGNGNKVAALWMGSAGLMLCILAFTVQLQGTLTPPQSTGPSEADVARDRAYVAPFDATISIPYGERPAAILIIKNTGRTQATDLTVRMVFSITSYPLIPSIPIDESVAAPNYILEPDAILSQQWTSDSLPKDVQERLASGLAAVVITGVIRYTDYAGNSRKRMFKLYNANVPTITPGKFATASDGNSTD